MDMGLDVKPIRGRSKKNLQWRGRFFLFFCFFFCAIFFPIKIDLDTRINKVSFNLLDDLKGCTVALFAVLSHKISRELSRFLIFCNLEGQTQKI